MEREQETTEQATAKLLRRMIDRRVARLRVLADVLDGATQTNLARAEAGEAPYALVAANFANTLAHGLANIDLRAIIGTAYDADMARARGE